jgi:hypothetical protein
MVCVCLAADVADKENNTINKENGFGDRPYEIILHLMSMAVMLLGLIFPYYRW